MPLKRKINWLLYFLLSTTLWGAGYYLYQLWEKSNPSLIPLLISYLGTMINHYLMIVGSDELIKKTVTGKASSKLISFCYIFKILILAGALVFSSQTMGNKVIIAIICYVLTIFILYFCIGKGNRGNS